MKEFHWLLWIALGAIILLAVIMRDRLGQPVEYLLKYDSPQQRQFMEQNNV